MHISLLDKITNGRCRYIFYAINVLIYNIFSKNYQWPNHLIVDVTEPIENICTNYGSSLYGQDRKYSSRDIPASSCLILLSTQLGLRHSWNINITTGIYPYIHTQIWTHVNNLLCKNVLIFKSLHNSNKIMKLSMERFPNKQRINSWNCM